jgi:UMF1 family MFS transporter
MAALFSDTGLDTAPPVEASAGLPRSALAWALYEGARTPYVILIKVYIFIPYLATVLVGNVVAGQALVAKLVMGYGLFSAFTSPLLGAAMDRVGPRKPVLALITAAMVVLIASLWWATPDDLGLTATCAIVFAAGVLFAYTEVLHNSMLPYAAPARQTSSTSGLGLALGSGISVVLLVLVLWAFALPAKMHAPFLPMEPLFGLSAATHETDRIVAPIAAIVFALGAIPLFLFGRDAPRGAGGGASASLRQMGATIRSLKSNRTMAIFLGSRMLYTDGMTAILLFTGVYAAGVMHWAALELVVFAILVSCFLTIGGIVGARLDRAFGPRRAIQIELGIVIVGQLLILGLAPDRLFYLPYAGEAVWNGPMFRTLPEINFLAVGCLNAIGICGSYASSRSMLTRLATPETVGSWFGLYALSGTATVWLGSALVGLATALWGTQQAGFGVLVALLVCGFIGMAYVKAPDDMKVRA